MTRRSPRCPRPAIIRAAVYIAAAAIAAYYAALAATVGAWATGLQLPGSYTLRVSNVGALADDGASLLLSNVVVGLRLDARAPVALAVSDVSIVVRTGDDALLASATVSGRLDVPSNTATDVRLLARATLHGGGVGAVINGTLANLLQQAAGPEARLTAAATVDVPLLRPFVVGLEVAVTVDVPSLVTRLWGADAGTRAGATDPSAPPTLVVRPTLFADAVMEALGPALAGAPSASRAAITAELRDTALALGPRYAGVSVRAPAWLLDAVPPTRAVPGLGSPAGATWALREVRTRAALSTARPGLAATLSLLSAAGSSVDADARLVQDVAILNAPSGLAARWLLQTRAFPVARAVSAAIIAPPVYLSPLHRVNASVAHCIASGGACAVDDSVAEVGSDGNEAQAPQVLAGDVLVSVTGWDAPAAAVAVACLLDAPLARDLSVALSANDALIGPLRGVASALLGGNGGDGSSAQEQRVTLTVVPDGRRSFVAAALRGVTVSLPLSGAALWGRTVPAPGWLNALLGDNGVQLAIGAGGGTHVRVSMRGVHAPPALAVSASSTVAARGGGGCAGGPVAARVLLADDGASGSDGAAADTDEPFGGLVAAVANVLAGQASAPQVTRLTVDTPAGLAAPPGGDPCAHVGTLALAHELLGCSADDGACAAGAAARALAATAQVSVEQATMRSVVFRAIGADGPVDLPLLLLRHPTVLAATAAGGGASDGGASVNATLPVAAVLQACVWRVWPAAADDPRADLTTGATLTYGVRVGLVVVDAGAVWGADDVEGSGGVAGGLGTAGQWAGPLVGGALRPLTDVLVNGATIPSVTASAEADSPGDDGGAGATLDFGAILAPVFAGSRFRVELASRSSAAAMVAAQARRIPRATSPGPALYRLLDGLAMNVALGGGGSIDDVLASAAGASGAAAAAAATVLGLRVFDALPVPWGAGSSGGVTGLRPTSGMGALLTGIFSQADVVLTPATTLGMPAARNDTEAPVPLNARPVAWTLPGAGDVYERLLSASAARLSGWRAACDAAALLPGGAYTAAATACAFPLPRYVCTALAAAAASGEAAASTGWDGPSTGRMAATVAAARAACASWGAPAVASAEWRFSVDVPQFYLQLPAVDVGALAASVRLRPSGRGGGGTSARQRPAATAELDATATGSWGVNRVELLARLALSQGRLDGDSACALAPVSYLVCEAPDSLARERLLAALVSGAALDGASLVGAHRGLAFRVPLRRLGLPLAPSGVRAAPVDDLLISAAGVAELAAGTAPGGEPATVHPPSGVTGGDGAAAIADSAGVPGIAPHQALARLHTFAAAPANGSAPALRLGVLLTNVSPGGLVVSSLVGASLVALVGGTACGTVAVGLRVASAAAGAAAGPSARVTDSLASLAAAGAPAVGGGYTPAAIPAWAVRGDALSAGGVVRSNVLRPVTRSGGGAPPAVGGALRVVDLLASVDAWAAAVAPELPGAASPYVADPSPLELPLGLVAACTGLAPDAVGVGLASGTMVHLSLPLEVAWVGGGTTAVGERCNVAALVTEVAAAFPVIDAGAAAGEGAPGAAAPFSSAGPRVLPSCRRPAGGGGGAGASCGEPAHVHVVGGAMAVRWMSLPPVLLRLAPPLVVGEAYELMPAAAVPLPAPPPWVACAAPVVVPAITTPPPRRAAVGDTVTVRVVWVAPGGIALAAVVGLLLVCAAAELCCCCYRATQHRCAGAGGRGGWLLVDKVSSSSSSSWWWWQCPAGDPASGGEAGAASRRGRPWLSLPLGAAAVTRAQAAATAPAPRPPRSGSAVVLGGGATPGGASANPISGLEEYRSSQLGGVGWRRESTRNGDYTP